MTPDIIAGLISLIGVFLSLMGSVFIAGLRWGNIKTRLDIMERSQQNMATKEQLATVKEDIAEIKGMFRMTLKGDSS